jgi:hypothetical protein
MIKPIDQGPGRPEKAHTTEHIKPADKQHSPEASYKYKAMDKPMTWLHMQFTGPEAKKLWDSIIQQVTASIRKEQARALKALRKLRKSETSNDD